MGCGNVIKELRKDLAEAIGAIHFLPERVQPPVAVISAGNPYIEIETYCDKTVNLVVTLIVGRSDNEVALDALDDYIYSTMEALPHWATVEYVEQPFLLEWNGAVYLASRIEVQTNL